MNFTCKKFIPNYKGGKLDKNNAMVQCYNNFRSMQHPQAITQQQLQQLGAFLQDNLVYSNIIWKDNHRNKDNAILDNIDLLIFDIDENMTLDEALALPFQVMLLTTSSHTEEQDKFRVFIPLSIAVSFTDSTEYTEFLRIIDTQYFNNRVDKSCLEVARAYITTDKAQYQLNQSDVVFDPSNIIKQSKMNALTARIKATKCSNNVSTNKHSIEGVKKFKRVQEIASTFSSGNHYREVYEIMGIGKRAGLSVEECAQLIMSYNLGAEYSNFKDLVKKAKTLR